MAVTVDMLYAFASQLGVRVVERPLGELLGYYDNTRRIILMAENLTHAQYKSVLAHEIVHASFNDDACSNAEYCRRQEARCKRITARLLISDADYALAEGMYDGSVPAIANELQVTQQIVRDYQSLLTIEGTHNMSTIEKGI